MNYKISVIVPVYNVEKYLKKCLESIIKQTYSNLEILVINDGSTDLSGKIIDELALEDKRIKVYHQKNQGLSGARNTGLKNITGDYVTFIDSDDFIDKNMLKDMLNALIETNSDISICGMILCDERGEEIKKVASEKRIEYLGNKQMEELIKGRNIPTTSWGKLIKKDLLENFEFPLGKYHEDVFTTYKLLDKSNKTIVLNKGYYYYRQVSGSIMNSSFKEKHMDAIEAICQRADFIENNYSELKEYEYANVVYSCCKVYERMIKVDFKDKEKIKKLEFLIKKYIKYFLIKGKSQIKTKMFAICCIINMEFCRNIYNIFFKIRSKRN